MEIIKDFLMLSLSGSFSLAEPLSLSDSHTLNGCYVCSDELRFAIFIFLFAVMYFCVVEAKNIGSNYCYTVFHSVHTLFMFCYLK